MHDPTETRRRDCRVFSFAAVFFRLLPCFFVCCGPFCRSKITEACRAAVLACVERSTNSEGRIVEVNAFADFFSKAMSEST